jgi:hypothetical protein
MRDVKKEVIDEVAMCARANHRTDGRTTIENRIERCLDAYSRRDEIMMMMDPITIYNYTTTGNIIDDHPHYQHHDFAALASLMLHSSQLVSFL